VIYPAYIFIAKSAEKWRIDKNEYKNANGKEVSMLKAFILSTALVLGTMTNIVHVAPAQAGERAVRGGLIGAGAGALIGGVATGRAGGAVAGAVVGGAAGAIIGNEQDKKRRYGYRNSRRGYYHSNRRYVRDDHRYNRRYDRRYDRSYR
jgi:osmotically inducible lipoprotein OsmB